MLTAMGDVMREAYKRGWITTRDGNISVKMNGYLYVTPSSSRKYIIHPENIIKLKIVRDETDNCDKLYLKSDLKPSIELDMHWNIQRQIEVRAVVHLHPTHTIAAMHAGYDLQKLAEDFVELGRFTRVGPAVPMLPPGSEELATLTADCISNSDIVGQVGHGVTAKAKNPWDAFEHIERLEHICQIVLASGVRP